MFYVLQLIDRVGWMLQVEFLWVKNISNMCPLMFEIFINDFPEVIEGYCKRYADDSNIIRVNESESS